MEDQAYTVKELAYHWNVSTDRVYEMVKSQRVQAFRVGGQWRISRDAVKKFEETPVVNAKGRPVLQIN